MHRLWWLALALIGGSLVTLFIPADQAGSLWLQFGERQELRSVQVLGLVLLVGGSLLLLYLTHLHMEMRLRRRREEE